MRMRTWTEELATKRPFTISTGSVRRVTALFVELEHDGIRGFGEAAPILRVTGETPASVQAFWDAVRPEMEQRTPADWTGTMRWLDMRAFGNPAAKGAVACALLDLVGKAHRKPAHAMLGIKPAEKPTSATVVLADPAAMAKEAVQHLEAGFDRLKLKLGEAADDAERVRAVRDACPQATLRCDANGGWTEAEARKLLRVLEACDVELLEQPVPRGFHEQMKRISKDAALPVLADEDALGVADVKVLASERYADGFVLKLAKCGGLWQAKQMLDAAQKAKLKVMVGCMVESSLGIAASAQLLGSVHWVDLDGAWLLASDPWSGADIAGGKVRTPEGHGLGASTRGPAA